jgi:hypothetical protein
MMTNSPGKTTSLPAALAVSLPSRPNQLDSQKHAPPYAEGKLYGHVCVHGECTKQQWRLCKKDHNARDDVKQK